MSEQIVALDNVDGAGSSPSEWINVRSGDVFGVSGISGDTVDVEYRINDDQTEQTLHSFTADGEKVNNQCLQIRFKVSTYSAGDIKAWVLRD